MYTVQLNSIYNSSSDDLMQGLIEFTMFALYPESPIAALPPLAILDVT